MEGDYPKFAKLPSNWTLDERVPVGHAYAFGHNWNGASTKWGNPLLEELKTRRAAEVAGAGIRWPMLSDGTQATRQQFFEAQYEWLDDRIDVQFDGVGNEVYVHSRWGVLRSDKPTGAVEHDKRSGERYWPLKRV